MKKEPICFSDGNIYAYEILTGKPQSIEDDFRKFMTVCSYLPDNKNEPYYHINLYPKTLTTYSTEILAIVRNKRKNIVIELVEINSSIDLEELKKIILLGDIKISIDDFGSRSSNFDRLNLPNIVSVKFDKYFWKNRRMKEIVKTTVSSLRKNKIMAVAEMVETKEDLTEARILGFNLFQGFYFCKGAKHEKVIA